MKLTFGPALAAAALILTGACAHHSGATAGNDTNATTASGATTSGTPTTPGTSQAATSSPSAQAGVAGGTSNGGASVVSDGKEKPAQSAVKGTTTDSSGMAQNGTTSDKVGMPSNSPSDVKPGSTTPTADGMSGTTASSGTSASSSGTTATPDSSTASSGAMDKGMAADSAKPMDMNKTPSATTDTSGSTAMNDSSTKTDTSSDANLRSVTGSVSKIDAQGQSITLDQSAGSTLTLTVDSSTKVLRHGKPLLGIQSLREGQKIRASFDPASNKASKIEIVGARHGRHAKTMSLDDGANTADQSTTGGAGDTGPANNNAGVKGATPEQNNGNIVPKDDAKLKTDTDSGK